MGTTTSCDRAVGRSHLRVDGEVLLAAGSSVVWDDIDAVYPGLNALVELAAEAGGSLMYDDPGRDGVALGCDDGTIGRAKGEAACLAMNVDFGMDGAFPEEDATGARTNDFKALLPFHFEVGDSEKANTLRLSPSWYSRHTISRSIRGDVHLRRS